MEGGCSGGRRSGGLTDYPTEPDPQFSCPSRGGKTTEDRHTGLWSVEDEDPEVVDILAHYHVCQPRCISELSISRPRRTPTAYPLDSDCLHGPTPQIYFTTLAGFWGTGEGCGPVGVSRQGRCDGRIEELEPQVGSLVGESRDRDRRDLGTCQSEGPGTDPPLIPTGERDV